MLGGSLKHHHLGALWPKRPTPAAGEHHPMQVNR
jgi:hypothetical protein